MTCLADLHADIEARVTFIRERHADWLCRIGCDACCRRLADVPRLTAAEWDLLKAGLQKLPPPQLHAIGRAIGALAEQASRPLVCPLLDREAGACRVYDQRPVACRTYGFYFQRDKGLYCRDIEAQVAEGACDEVVWGNHDAVDRSLLALGESRDLCAWFAEWQTQADWPGHGGL